jgi:hypothetical protein
MSKTRFISLRLIAVLEAVLLLPSFGTLEVTMIRLCGWSRLDSTIPVRMVRIPSVKGDLESFLTICQMSRVLPRIGGSKPSTTSFNRFSISTDDLTVLFKCSNKNAISILKPMPRKPAIKTMSSFLGLMGLISIIASSTIRALSLSTPPVSVVSLVRLRNIKP